jgi:hypothetical protein
VLQFVINLSVAHKIVNHIVSNILFTELNLIFCIMSSNISFDTLDSRKTAFMMLYNEQKYDIVEIANKLNIGVGITQSIDDEILGFIRYRDNKFQIVVNNSQKIDEPMTNARVQTTIAHEVAHWIYDYDAMISDQRIFCENINDTFQDESESKAAKVATNIIMGLKNPLI